MQPIEIEHWEPNPENPSHLRYVGQPVAEEVFAELKQRLEATGFLPDEYFVIGMEWENGRQIPKGADVFCATDYGESEGVYVDVYLKWYENGKSIIKSFAVGKTLGESSYDLDRMFLTASAITKAFHGEGMHNESARGMILTLNTEERNALREVLARQEQTPALQSLAEKLGGVRSEPTQMAQESWQTQTAPGMEMIL